jgi:Zn ribbon nucleic-acid-binding protein
MPERIKTPRDCPVCTGIGKLLMFSPSGVEVVDCGECDGGRAVPASVDDDLAVPIPYMPTEKAKAS